jgi:GMP synthase-like glutamine amidotransferase
VEPIVFVRADASETFGIGPAAVAGAGASVHVWDALGGEPPPRRSDTAALVLFGSTFNVEHADEQPYLHTIRDTITAFIEAGVPYLGLCFGAQALAWSLGATVDKAPVREFGYTPIRPLPALRDDPVLGHFEDGDMVFQWHMDTFELPAGATLLATGDEVVHQAFRVGDHAWATQFHLEVDRAELEAWLEEEAAVVEAEWGKSRAAVLAEADRWQARHEDRGTEVFRRFVAVAQERS